MIVTTLVTTIASLSSITTTTLIHHAYERLKFT